MAPTVLSSLEVEGSSHQPSRLLEAEKTTPKSRRLAQQRGIFPQQEGPSEPAQRYQQSPSDKTGCPRRDTLQAAQAAAGTPKQRPICPGRKTGLGTRARNAADAKVDRLSPAPLQHSTSTWEPCGQRHRLSPRLPDRTRAFPPLTHELPEHLCSAETRGGFFHLPASFGNQLAP